MYTAYLVIILLFTLPATVTLHLKGTWNTKSEFFKFLAKFGFQRTIRNDKTNSQGYIFGNISLSRGSLPPGSAYPATLVVVHQRYFMEYYGNRSHSLLGRPPLDDVCRRMFTNIDTIAFDADCYDRGREDFLRKIPCPVGKFCVDEDKPQSLVAGTQFVYGVQDVNQPRFWYISMVACHRVGSSSNCTWKHDPDLDISIDYDIWLVNGNPYNKHQNPFEYQFSFDRQDTVELYSAFFVLHAGLLTMQIYAAIRQKHMLARILAAVIGFALAANFFHLVHALKFAFDGEGVVALEIFGDVGDILSQTLFMLLLLLLAKGWGVSRQELTRRSIIFTLWGIYLWTNVLLYVWNQTEIDVIEDIDEWQTWPGVLTLSLRLALMLWFIWELRRTMAQERCPITLQFFLHFGASSLVWFFYLPIMAVVAVNMSALWRYKLTRGVRYSVNFLAYAALAHLLWPTRSQQYTHLTAEADQSDELEEFSQAPHVLHPLPDTDINEPSLDRNNHNHRLSPPITVIHTRPERA